MQKLILVLALVVMGQVTYLSAQTILQPLMTMGGVTHMQEVNSVVYVNVWNVALNQYSFPHDYVFSFTPSATKVCLKHVDDFYPSNFFSVQAPDIWLSGYTPYTPHDHPMTISLTNDCQLGDPHGELGIYPKWTYLGDSLFFDPSTKKMYHFPDFTEVSIPWEVSVDGFSVFYENSEHVFYTFSVDTSGFQERTFNRQGALLDEWSVPHQQEIAYAPSFIRNKFTGDWLVHYYRYGLYDSLLLVSHNPQSVKRVSNTIGRSLFSPSGYYSWAIQPSDSTIVSVEYFNLQGDVQWKKYCIIDTIPNPDAIGAQILTSAGKILVGITTNMHPFIAANGTTWHGGAHLLTTDENFEGFVDTLPKTIPIDSIHVDSVHVDSLTTSRLYPNPIKTGQHLEIKKVDTNLDATIRIISTDGKIMVDEPLLTPFFMPKLPSSGIYYVQVVQADAVISSSLFYLE